MTTFSALFTAPDPDLKIRGAGHPGLPLNKGGRSPFGPQFGLKIRGDPGSSPGSATSLYRRM